MSIATHTRTRRRLHRSILAASALAVGLGGSAGLATSAGAAALSGTITADSGALSSPYTGSWVRLHVDGSPSALYTNPASPAANQTYTPLVNSVVSGGGLKLGTTQAEASPAYDVNVHSLSDDIVSPQLFGLKKFGVFTTSGPTLNVAGGTLAASEPITSGDLGGWTVDYDNTSYPTSSNTTTGNLAGSITWNDVSDHSLGGHIVLTWTADITNGPFEPYTSIWRYEGELA